MKFININGTRVKALRQAANLTQTELAELLPITKQAISKIENKGEDAQIRDTTLQPLAKALQCTAEYLRGQTNYFNEFKNAYGVWETNLVEYNFQPLENRLILSEIINIIKDLSINRLVGINDLCKIIAKSEAIKD